MDIAARLTNSAMRSVISRSRGDFYPGVPGSLEELGNLLTEHPHLTATQDEGDNFFAGMVRGPGTVSLLFMSRRMQPYVGRSSIVSCDGTFNSRPQTPNSAQVLQIVGVVDHHVSQALILFMF